MNDTPNQPGQPDLPEFPASARALPAHPSDPSLLVAHTAQGPVPFAQPAAPVTYYATATGSGAPSGAGQPPRRERRARRGRRVALIAGAAAFTILAGAGIGTSAFALVQSNTTAASSDTSALVEPDTGVTPDTVTPYSQLPGTSPYGSQGGTGSGGGYSVNPYGFGSGGSSSGGTGSTQTDAVAATEEQTVGVVTIVSDLTYQSAQSAGTGIILTSDGLILTNNHVIEGSTSVEVTDELTGQSYSAEVVGTDATHDIAVLQLQDAGGLTPASLGDSDSVAAGDSVTAVGNAEGTGDLVAASGTVAALGQTITTQSEQGIEGETLNNLIQVDADIVSGDSGGPLRDASGDVVGISTAASSGSAEITGFAIPLSDALDIVAQIEQGVDTEYIEIGYPGFLGIGVAQDTGRASGATVAGVIAGTPAEQSGLAEGDVITAVNGQSIASGAALSALLATMEPGETIDLTWTTATGTAGSATVTLMAGPAA